jgi:hypothetical protein
MSGDWYVVLEWAHPYDGVEIRRGKGLEIRIPFASPDSASVALAKMSTRIIRENPVIQGELVTGEIEGQR